MSMVAKDKGFSNFNKLTVKAPGRVNLLGEHVDYNGGIVLPVAIDRYVTVHAWVLREATIALEANDLNQCVIVPIEKINEKCDEKS